MSSNDTPGRGPVPTGEVMLPAAAHAYLTRAATSLRDAMVAADAPTKYACAHVAALQSAAALLAVRTVPGSGGRRRSRNAWVLLADAVPEMADWAALFSSGSATYQAAQAGSARTVTDDLAQTIVEDADQFLAVVEELLGLLPHADIDRTFGVA